MGKISPVLISERHRLGGFLNDCQPGVILIREEAVDVK